MKYIKILILIFWMSLIFWFSNQPGTVSTNSSNTFTYKVLDIIEKVSGKDFTQEEREHITKTYITPIRKSAHFFIYFILGILIIWNLISYYNLSKSIIIASIILTFIYAGTDELHQLFIEGRSSEFLDVLLDTCGGIIGILLFNLIKARKLINKV